MQKSNPVRQKFGERDAMANVEQPPYFSNLQEDQRRAIEFEHHKIASHDASNNSGNTKGYATKYSFSFAYSLDEPLLSSEFDIEIIGGANEEDKNHWNFSSMLLKRTESIVTNMESLKFIFPTKSIHDSSSNAELGAGNTTRKEIKHETERSCRQYSSDQLFKRLERVGGLNQIFMASTPEEAGQLFTEHDQLSTNTIESLRLSDHIADSQDIHSECSTSCKAMIENIRTVLNKEENQSRDSSIDLTYNDMTQHADLKQSLTTSCTLGTFVRLLTSVNQVEHSDTGFLKLCLSHKGVYILEKNCFPRFVNAVNCQIPSSTCIFDTLTKRGHGKCNSKTIIFKVLYNDATDICQNWKASYIEVPVACECVLSQYSPFLRATQDGHGD